MAGVAGLKSSLNDLLTLYTTVFDAAEDEKKTGKTSEIGSLFKQIVLMFEPHGKKDATAYEPGCFLTKLSVEIGWIEINDG